MWANARFVIHPKMQQSNRSVSTFFIALPVTTQAKTILSGPMRASYAANLPNTFRTKARKKK